MGLLQEKMRRDIRIRGLSQRTENHYIRNMIAFTRYFGISPDKLNLEHILQFQEHLVGKGLSSQSVNLAVASIRFFYLITLKKDWGKEAIPRMKVRRVLPVILSPSEIATIFNGVENLKHRAIFATIYSAGLRVSEATHLAAKDIDSQRGVIHVRFGKGMRERYTLLSAVLLPLLRTYWKESKENKSIWLFPSHDPKIPINQATVRKAFVRAVEKSGIQKKVNLHSMRHSFATHLLEARVDLRYIQCLLGHATIASTTIYTHMRDVKALGIISPLDAVATKLTW